MQVQALEFRILGPVLVFLLLGVWGSLKYLYRKSSQMGHSEAQADVEECGVAFTKACFRSFQGFLSG